MSAKEQLRQKVQQQLITGQSAAKWAPREGSAKGKVAREMMEFFGMSPKFYRRSIADLSETTEQKMCSGQWDSINFSVVPSVCHARNKKTFGRNSSTYAEYVQKLVKGDPTVSIKSGAIFPHDVLKGRIHVGHNHIQWDAQELAVIEAQWAALPNFIGDAKVLPLVDVSGSMTCPAGTKGTTTCLEVAVSLGLYFADKNTGPFKDCMLTFSGNPQLVKLTGSINQKIDQMVATAWQMNTDLNKAFTKILTTAVQNKVPAEEMPRTLVILSDMAVDQCVDNPDNSALEMIRDKYAAAGYSVPGVVFWNLNDKGNVPVKFDQSGTALVSGFSPAIAKSVLSADMSGLTPEAIMRDAVCIPRYDMV